MKRIDLTGQRFGKLTVVKFLGMVRDSQNRTHSKYLCKCDCGNFTEVRAGNLRNGGVKSCGCIRKDIEHKYNDLSGKRFGRWTVIERVYQEGMTGTLFKCECDCGNTGVVSSSTLLKGKSKSCGCYQKIYDAESNKTHGMSGTRIWRIWSCMKARCNNEKDTTYQYYGARGIKVCDDWNNSFESFHEWSVDNGYNENLTLDRIDVDGNYEPENCRWITMKEQGSNRRNNVLYELNGQKKTLPQWGEEYGIDYRKVYRRMYYSKWDLEKALTTPIQERRKNCS